MERVAAMPDASLYVNRDGRRADDCVDSHGGGNLTKIPRSVVGPKNLDPPNLQILEPPGSCRLQDFLILAAGFANLEGPKSGNNWM